MVTGTTSCPETIEAAAKAKADGAILYAGGTDVMLRYAQAIRTGQTVPFVFLNVVNGLKDVVVGGSKTRIGAMITMSKITRHPDIPDLLRQACGVVGSPALRNVATLGGNICTASPAGDSLPALCVLEALVELRSPTKTRIVPIDKFISGPKETVLAPDELLVAVIIPDNNLKCFYHRKVSSRTANAITKVSIAAATTIEDGIIKDIRLAFGAVGPTVIRCTSLEQELKGISADKLPKTMPHWKHQVAKLIEPIDDLRSTAQYRCIIASNLFEEIVNAINKRVPEHSGLI
ncbi:MAG: FAD binding domain-containing protein [Proteobacteria bacterium]|nr:FAD binding domain-containing protein [Pseudomonadota bacterium]